MKNISHPPFPNSQRGIVMLEALIAILIFSLGILGLVGLQASMIKNTAEAKFRTEASNVAQSKIGQMWANQGVNGGNLANLAENTDISQSSGLPNGRLITVLNPTMCNVNGIVAPCEMSVTVTWQQPGGGVHNVTTIARITGG